MALSRKRKIIIASAAAVVLAMVVIVSLAMSRNDAPEVVAVRVESRPELRSIVTASGEVRPVQFINLTSDVPGRIEEIFVNPGDQVQRGQPLVRLDPTQLQSSQEAQFAGVQASLNDVQNARTQVIAAENGVAQAQQGLIVSEAAVAQARQQIVTAQTSVDRAQVDLQTAQRELRRTEELIESGVASRAELDAARDRQAQAQVSLRTAEAQLQQQRIGVEEARARVNQQRISVADARRGVQSARGSVATAESRASQQQALLRGEASQRAKATQLSPLTGVVADIPARVGQFAVSGLSTTALMTIADMTTINVEVNVDETEISKVEVGQSVRVKVDALGEREIEGVVRQKNPLAIGRSDTQGGLQQRVNVQEAKEFRVVIELRNMPDEIRNGLRPGMTATANITTQTKQNVIAIPLQAIVERTAQSAQGEASPGASPAAAPSPAPGGSPQRGQKGVYILDGTRARFVEVTTGITGETDIEIMSGLTTDMQVITGPSRVLRTLRDNAVVSRQTRRPGANANANANGG